MLIYLRGFKESRLTTIFFSQENVTKWASMKLAMQEQVKERQEIENKMQKLIKTMYHFGRAKREEATPLIFSLRLS